MRYCTDLLVELAGSKFVLVSGPRQAGKTTLAKAWIEREGGRYLNWDAPRDRQEIRAVFGSSRADTHRLALDEIHKHVRWKQNLKGLFDLRGSAHDPNTLQVVVTGSAKLDTYKRGGDSLLGRYDQIRLHPFSVGEVARNFAAPMTAPVGATWTTPGRADPEAANAIWRRLQQYSGFPEPYTAASRAHHERWRLRRRDLVLREDIRDVSQVRQLSLVEDLALLLPERVGSPLSQNSLREDLGVAFDTVKSWLDVLERLYYCYRLRPFTSRLARSLTKENKLYLWDWTEVDDPGARFENMVASHLLKAVHYWRDCGEGDYSLQYWRDKEKREIDFIVVNGKKPVLALECKLADTSVSPSLQRFAEHYVGVPTVQLVDVPGVWKRTSGVSNTLVASAATWLAALP
jgi:uncharacterized protein